jgi:hypothetical protein
MIAAHDKDERGANAREKQRRDQEQ